MGYYQPLESHPNFKVPGIPTGSSVEDAVRFTIEYVARLMSPLKLPGESVDRECHDVADEIRGHLPKILKTLAELDGELSYHEAES